MAKTPTDLLKEKIEAYSAHVGIMGLGYVGLPLAVEFARVGFPVTGFDPDEERVNKVRQGTSFIKDVPTAEIKPLVASQRLSVTSAFELLREMDVLSICVPTPLNKTRDPDVSYILDATEKIRQALRPGQLVILESTTYPGTTRELLLPALEGKGLKVGRDFCLVFSPERVDPGNSKYTIRNTPKVLGGITQTCTEVATALYSRVVERVVPVSSPETAEMAKLLENTFRSVNIALVNEVAIYCDRLGVDVWEVIEVAATKPFGFMKFYPGPGLGGHCIPIDPHYLSWKLKTVNYKARFIELASEVNTQMPFYVVGKIVDALNRHAKSVKGSRILVLGIAYKRDIEDIRESPALDIINLLQEKGAEVLYHDPYVPQLSTDHFQQVSVDLTPGLFATVDCVVITTDHSDLPYAEIVARAPLIVDTRNATRHVQNGREKIIRL